MKAQLALQQDSRGYFSSQEMYPKRERAARHASQHFPGLQSMLPMVNLCGNTLLTAVLLLNRRYMMAISISVLRDNRLHAVSSRSGKVLWTYFTEGPIRSSPRIAEGHIFFGSDDGYLHVVNLTTNRRAWRAEIGSPVRSSPFIDNELIYFGSESGELICTDFTGVIKWQVPGKKSYYRFPDCCTRSGLCYFSGWILLCIGRKIRLGHLAFPHGQRIDVFSAKS